MCQMLITQIVLFVNLFVMELTNFLGNTLAGHRISDIITCLITISYLCMNVGFARMV